MVHFSTNITGCVSKKCLGLLGLTSGVCNVILLQWLVKSSLICYGGCPRSERQEPWEGVIAAKPPACGVLVQFKRVKHVVLAWRDLR